MKEILSVLWSPVMVALTVAMRNATEEKEIRLILEGFEYAIQLLGKYKLEMERDAYVVSLT